MSLLPLVRRYPLGHASRLLRCLSVVLSCCLIVLFTVVTKPAWAILPVSTPPASATAATPQDTLGRGTPRGTVQGFIQALAKDDLMLASRYLDIDNNSNPTTVLHQFKAALDSGGRISSELQISNDPAGSLDDKLAPNLDKVGEIDSSTGQVDVLLERVKSGDHQIWLVSQKTLSKLPDLAARTKPTLVEQYMPKDWLQSDIKGFSMGQIAAVFLVLLVTYILSLLISWLLYLMYLVIYHINHRHDDDKNTNTPVDRRVIVPMAMVLTSVVIKELMLLVGINLVIRNFVERMADILSWVALAWLLMRIIDLLFNRADRLAIIGNHPERVSVLSLVRKVVKVLLLVVATIVILGNLGFDLTTGIAALGIGGLALALGAQKTIENLVGSVSLVADQPINVGDYCRFGNQEGTVEDIGIRSTRIRTSNRTVVTIPNGSFSSMSIENFTSRDMFYFLHNFYVARDSDSDKIRAFIEQAQIYITNHPATNSVLNEVRIAGTQQDAYIIEVRCHMQAKGVMDFNAKQTDMILSIADMLKAAGLDNALPTQQINIAQPHTEKADNYSI